jgi:hypothetical protein
VKELIWWRSFLSDMGSPPSGPSIIYCDNEAARRLSQHSCNFEATKHIRHRYHYVRECAANGEIRVDWCSNKTQWADILTKNCAVKHFRRIVSFLMGTNI